MNEPVIRVAEEKHTPGPWFLFKPGSACIESPSGNVAVTNLARASLADARLIAAAPDLLKALYECKMTLGRDVCEYDDIRVLLEVIDAAIARAEGRQRAEFEYPNEASMIRDNGDAP